mmetsp:Transcript_48004/g.89461  ORF Transcript_48004/g.89461 Transcript_48004/m.89461 type:complete len:295 (-) Transcript_48004:2174-3058(-)
MNMHATMTAAWRLASLERAASSRGFSFKPMTARRMLRVPAAKCLAMDSRHSSSAATGEAYVGVSQAVSTYFSALHARDAELMQRVWHPRAHLKRLDENDEVVDIPSEKFLQIVREGTPTADQAAIRRDRILNIDVLHPEQAALATVQVTLPPKTYTDFLSLLKLDGEWRIVNKVFTSVEESELSYQDNAPFSKSYDPISACLKTYFSAGHHSDPDLMQEAMHSSCCLYASENGALYERDLHTFLRDMCKRESATGPEITKFDKIISITKVHTNHANGFANPLPYSICEYCILLP